MVLGADNLPLIAYLDSNTSSLKAVQCLNVTCTSLGPIFTVDAAGVPLSRNVSMTLSSEGLPLIAYYDAISGDLRVAKCPDSSCSGAAAISTVDSAGLVGGYPSIALGADGFPVIAYYDYSNSDLKVAKCADVLCSGAATLTTVDSSGSVGTYASIALGADGLPMLAYYASPTLRFARCADSACAGATIHTVDSGGDSGAYASMVLGVDGLPVIAYLEFNNVDLKVAKCANVHCINYFGR